MEPLVFVEFDDNTAIKTLIEIMNGAFSEAPAQFIKNIDVYESKLKREIKQVRSEPTITSEEKKESTKKKITKKKITNKKPTKANLDVIKKIESDLSDTEKSGKNEKKTKKKQEEPEKEEVTRETNKGQIKILTTDQHQILISYIELNAIDFKRFEMLPDEYTAGWNIEEFFKWIKSVDKDGKMTMRIEQDDLQNMILNVDSGSKENKCALKVLNPQEKPKRHIEISFTMAIRMLSAEFHKACKELSQFSTHAEIICNPEKLTITCKGEMSSHSRSFKCDGSETGAVIKCVKSDAEKPDIVRLIFELKHINLMYKCLNLSKDIEIYLKPGSVMFLRYPIGLNSTMTVGIAPASLKEKVLGNMNYDDELDKYYDDEDIELLTKNVNDLSVDAP